MSPSDDRAWVYLQSCLAPFRTMLDRADVTDIYVNEPGELWIETLGGATERYDSPDLSEASLWRLARQVAAWNSQGISREHPLMSARLPDGARIQVVAPPATRGPIAIAIRKHVSADLSLDDYAGHGAFAETKLGSHAPDSSALQLVAQQSANGGLADALRTAVQARLNILVSGGTSTGKTTFLNALLREVPEGERLILIEDTPELRVRHANAIGLVAVRGALGEATVTADDLVSASLRMRPDRIILGELRGGEALAFLRAVNTGHPGSMTTIHANSPSGAVEQLVLLALQAGGQVSRTDLRAYIARTIDIFVQLNRVSGRRVVGELRLATELRGTMMLER